MHNWKSCDTPEFRIQDRRGGGGPDRGAGMSQETPMDGKKVNYLQKIVRLMTGALSLSAWTRLRLFPHSAFLFGMTFGSLVFAVDAPKNQQLWEVSVGMEKMYVRQVLQAMRKSVPTYSDFSQSGTYKFYQAMLDEQYADEMGQRGELGIAKMVYDYLEPASGAPPATVAQRRKVK